jgi:D-proline reductase (dithiol) PrdB
MTFVMPEPHSKYIEKTKQDYAKLGYEPYQWFQAEELPAFAHLQKPLSESKLGLISTAGTYVKGQKAFFTKDDTSIRRISSCTSVDEIRFAHIMQNYLVEARKDPCTVFPLEALKILEDEGVIGELAPEFLSCMGGIYSRSRVRDELIPRLERAVSDQQLDLLFLIPL